MRVDYVVPERPPTPAQVMTHLRQVEYLGSVRPGRGRRKSRPLRPNQRRITTNPHIQLGRTGRTGPYWITTGGQGGTVYQNTGYFQEYPQVGGVASPEETSAKYRRFEYLNRNPVEIVRGIPDYLYVAVRKASTGQGYQAGLERARQAIDSITDDERAQIIGDLLYNEAVEEIKSLTGSDVLLNKALVEASGVALQTASDNVDVDALRKQAALDKFATDRGGILGTLLYASGAVSSEVQSVGTTVTKTADKAAETVGSAAKTYFKFQTGVAVLAAIAVAAYAYRSVK